MRCKFSISGIDARARESADERDVAARRDQGFTSNMAGMRMARRTIEIRVAAHARASGAHSRGRDGAAGLRIGL